MATVKVQIPDNVSLNVGGHVYRAGEEFEAERDDTVEQWLRAGTVTEVKARRGRPPGVKASGKRSPGGTR